MKRLPTALAAIGAVSLLAGRSPLQAQVAGQAHEAGLALSGPLLGNLAGGNSAVAIWDKAAGGNWHVAANWNPQAIPNSNTAEAVFKNKPAGNAGVVADKDTQVQKLTFDSTTASYTISLAEDKTFRFTGASNAILFPASNVHNHSITAPFEISNSDLAITILDSSNLCFTLTGAITENGMRKVTISGTIANTSSLFEIQENDVKLEAINAFSGGLEVKNSLVTVSDDLALGAAGKTLTLDTGIVHALTAGIIPVTIARPVVLKGGGGGFSSNALRPRVTGVISGTGGVTIFRNGAEFRGNNTFQGGVRIGNDVSGSTLVVANDMGFGHADNDIEFRDQGGIQALAGFTSERNMSTPNNGGCAFYVDQGKVTWQGSIDLKQFYKTGDGKLVIDGTNSIDRIDVNTGTLQIDGNTTTGTGENQGIFVERKLAGKGPISGKFRVKSGGKQASGGSVGEMECSGDAVIEAGGGIELEIDHATGTQGGPMGWDHWALDGVLDVSAASPLELEVVTLGGDGLPGLASGFDPAGSYLWPFVTASGGIVGFQPAQVALDLAGFQNPAPGVFSVKQSGNSLCLSYGQGGKVPASGPLAGTLLALVLAGLGSGLASRLPPRGR